VKLGKTVTGYSTVQKCKNVVNNDIVPSSACHGAVALFYINRALCTGGVLTLFQAV